VKFGKGIPLTSKSQFIRHLIQLLNSSACTSVSLVPDLISPTSVVQAYYWLHREVFRRQNGLVGSVAAGEINVVLSEQGIASRQGPLFDMLNIV
jgi:hypothetical protein